MSLSLRAPALLVVAALGLSACDDNGNDGGSSADGIDTLGGDFVQAFNQDPNDEPLDASDLDLTLTPSVEPFDP